MTLAQILTAAASYLGKTSADLTVNSLDLGLLALNQVRTTAELTHDFEFNRKLATLTIDGVTGGSLDDVVITGELTSRVTGSIVVSGAGSTTANGTYVGVGTFGGKPLYAHSLSVGYYILWSNTKWLINNIAGPGSLYEGVEDVDTPDLVEEWAAVIGEAPVPLVTPEVESSSEIKTIIEIGTFDEGGNFRPIEWTTAAESLERQRDQVRPVTMRYPTDQEATSLVALTRVVVSGRNVFLVPKVNGEQVELGLEVYAMTPDWTDTSITPPVWGTKGSQFLLWQTVVHLNQLFKEFVPRQEGNLAPPKDLADEGLQALLTWDVMQFEQFRRHSRG